MAYTFGTSAPAAANRAASAGSTAFRTLPDLPIRRLDLVLPEGKASVLAASSSLCGKRPLRVLTAITAQDGARVKPAVSVAVAGCKKPKALTRAQKLARALKACAKLGRRGRAVCQRQRREQFGRSTEKGQPAHRRRASQPLFHSA